MGILILLPIYFVEVKGFEMIEASLAMLPFVFSMDMFIRITERILKRIDYFVVLFMGYLFVIIGFTLLINLDTDLYIQYLFIMMSVSGVGLGMIWVASNEMCKNSMAQKSFSLGNGFFVFVRTIGGIIGTVLFLLITLSFTHYFSSSVMNEGINKVENSPLASETKRAMIVQLENSHPTILGQYPIAEFTDLQGDSAVFKIVEEMNQMAQVYLVKAMVKAFFVGLMISCIFLFILPFVRLEENAQKLIFEKGRSY